MCLKAPIGPDHRAGFLPQTPALSTNNENKPENSK